MLTSFPSTVFLTPKRKIQAAIRAIREQIIADSLSGYALLFEPILGSDFLRRTDTTKQTPAILWSHPDLLDPVAYPADEVADFYLRRWEIEVKL